MISIGINHMHILFVKSNLNLQIIMMIDSFKHCYSKCTVSTLSNMHKSIQSAVQYTQLTSYNTIFVAMEDKRTVSDLTVQIHEYHNFEEHEGKWFPEVKQYNQYNQYKFLWQMTYINLLSKLKTNIFFWAGRFAQLITLNTKSANY